MNIFPEVSLTKTEIDIVAAHLSDPSVVKYLHMLAYNVGRNIVIAQANDHTSEQAYLRVIAGAQGQLAAIDTLLEISKPAEQQPSE